MTDSGPADPDTLSPLQSTGNSDRPVAIVTGAGRRIGRAVALSLANDLNLNVVVHYGRSRDQAEDVAEAIRTGGSEAITVSADLREPVTAADTIFDASNRLGTATVLINCAAVFADTRLCDVSIEHCEHHFAVNTFAPLFLTQELQQRLPSDRRAHVINILDWRATRPPASHLVYTASKAALAAITKCLAQQLAPRTFVNAIAPGAILPPEDRPDWHNKRAFDAIPMNASGRPSDVVAAVKFLLQSTFITGEILHVDGGEGL